MPSPRPRLINTLTRRFPKPGQYVQDAYDFWIRWRFYRFWEKRNLAARQAFEANRPELTEAQSQVLSELNDRGIAYIPFNRLFGDRCLWEDLWTDVKLWLDSPEVKERERTYKEEGHRRAVAKEYIIKLYETEGQLPILSWENKWLRLSLQAQIVDIVNGYFGFLSKLMYVNVWSTIALEHDHPLTGSQRWHRDPEDVKLLKVFLYFTDVDLEGGPLHYVPYSRKGGKYGHLWPQQIPGGSVLSEGELEAVVPREDWEICSAPKGTFVFADTTALHMEGRANKNNRVFAVWEFAPHSSLWPRYFKPDPQLHRHNLSSAAQYALLE